jgi:two-component system, OmpR family, phosphate regulon response regulator PhoB
MAAQPVQVLVVEDDPQLSTLIRSVLERDGLSVGVAGTARDAEMICQADHIDVVVLDLTLPDSQGFDVLVALRRRLTTPILVVSGRGGDDERVQGLDLGADDYLSKPFYVPELVARVRSLLRRSSSDEESRRLGWPGLQIDPIGRTAWFNGGLLALTRLEFDLLALLAGHPHRTFSKEELLRRVWASSSQWQSSATVTEHVRRLRRKVDDPAGAIIQTVHAVGYRLVPPGASGDDAAVLDEGRPLLG